MLKKAAETLLKMATNASLRERRTYLTGYPYKHLLNNFPLVKAALESASFQSFANCAAHQRELFDKILTNVSREAQPARDKDAAPTTSDSEQSAKKPVFTSSGFTDKDVEQSADVTIDNICKLVDERGMALLVHHGIGENYHETFHLVLVTNVFQIRGEAHAVLIDCNDLAENPSAKRARKQLSEGMELHDLPEDTLKATNARKSMVRVVALKPMLEEAEKKYQENVEKFDAYENMEGKNPMPRPISPALVAASQQFLKELPNNVRNLVLQKDEKKHRAFADLMTRHPTQIEFSDSWQQIYNKASRRWRR